MTKLDSIPFSTSAALVAEVDRFLKKVNEGLAIEAACGPAAVRVELGCENWPFEIVCASLSEAMDRLDERPMQSVSIEVNFCTLEGGVALRVRLSQERSDLQISGLHRPAALHAAAELSDFLVKSATLV